MKPPHLLLAALLAWSNFLLAAEPARPNIIDFRGKEGVMASDNDAAQPDPMGKEDLLFADNGTVKIGIDRTKGGTITWLSWNAYSSSAINVSDPGRLIQQSYYAGPPLDRRAEGQSKAWSPWRWNPIQGGGVGSWARVTEFKRLDARTLYAETVPKLWDMPNEEAAALMRQWTGFEPLMSNVVVVRCELLCRRPDDDRWGLAPACPQEIPACYFTRNFSMVKSYLGQGKWRVESQPPGPPWGKAEPPRKAMAFFAPSGQGIAVFSPAATQPWNYGPHGAGASDDPSAGPCMHVAPIDRVKLSPKSTYRYRYWLAIGTEPQLAANLDALWNKYSAERADLIARAASALRQRRWPPRDPTRSAVAVESVVLGAADYQTPGHLFCEESP